MDNLNIVQAEEAYSSEKIEVLCEITVKISKVGQMVMAEVSQGPADDRLPMEAYHIMAIEAIDNLHDEDREDETVQ